MDRSILSRFSPDGFFLPVQYLCRKADGTGAWEWLEDRDAAFVFDNSSIAWEERAKKEYLYRVAGSEVDHKPWAVVIGITGQEEAERRRRHKSRDEQTAASFRISPQECFERLEKQHLA